jgi:hypothetical protein
LALAEQFSYSILLLFNIFIPHRFYDVFEILLAALKSLTTLPEVGLKLAAYSGADSFELLPAI